MQKRGHATSLHELFASGRRESLFLRVLGLDAQAEADLVRLYGEALNSGAIFEGRIPPPSEANLSDYYRALGQDFRPEPNFIEQKLGSWLPGMPAEGRTALATALTDMLGNMARAGKTAGMQKNAYVHCMCWLRFRFERVARRLSAQPLPLVLYQGDVSSLELRFFTALCNAGCDIVLVQPGGDAAYLRLDPGSELSDAIGSPRPFPPNFSMGALYRSRAQQANQNPRPAARNAGASAYESAQPSRPGISGRSTLTARPGPAPSVTPRQPATPAARTPATQRPAPINRPASQGASGVSMRPGASAPPPEVPLRLPRADFIFCTNAWMDSAHIDSFESIATPHRARGTDAGQIYNCFIRMDGAEDKLTYPSQLIQLHQRLVSSDRKIFIQSGDFEQPRPEETVQIRRGNYASVNAAIEHLATNLRTGVRLELQNTFVRAFMEVLSEEAKKPGMSVNRIVNSAVYMLCWFRRCAATLFGEWRPGSLGCIIALNVCTGPWAEREALFLRMMARTPTDVLVLNPNLNVNCVLDDELLFTQHFTDSLVLPAFPQEHSWLRASTVAAQAEQDISGVLYGEGLYRDRQFAQAQSLTLHTTYEEVLQYWDIAPYLRPQFSTVEGKAILPVLFAQASGVKGGKLEPYWREIRKLFTNNCYVVKMLPFIQPDAPNPYSGVAVECLRNGKLQRDKLRNHSKYPFGLLKEEVQAHMLDKLQVLIDSRRIRGTFENGTEYQIVATVLNMVPELVRLIQQFDFTKKNPKLLCINTAQTAASKQDAILFAYLNLICFDVVCYIPTGFQCVNQWYTDGMMEEHQLGDYIYDLYVPDFSQIPTGILGRLNRFRR